MKNKFATSILCIFFCLLLLFSLTSCTNKKESVSLDNFSASHKIIIDTDTAGDDGVAIAMAVKAPNIEVLGVTVMAGNVSLNQAAKNALAVLETAGASNIPVYCGAEESLDGKERECYSVFGNDGMGDVDIIHPTATAQEEDAVSFIIDTINKNPNEIELVCIGPMTNIAKAIEQDFETMKKVKMIWSMGTTGFGSGNATPVSEFNVYKDAVAYNEVIASGIPMTIIGLDICEKETALYTESMLNELKNGNSLEQFIRKSFTKFIEFKKSNGKEAIDICDATSMYALIYEDAIIDYKECAAICITDEGPTYGQVIFYIKNYTYDSMPNLPKSNIKVITALNDGSMYQRLRYLLSK